jgi:DNA mismatch repair protein MutH
MSSAAPSQAEPESAKTTSNRAEVRKRCFMAATITFNKGLTTWECVVRNISEGGARIDIDRAVALPTHFELYIPIQQKRLQAELKWRSENEAGIQFRREEEEAEAESNQEESAALRRRIKELEAEVLRLQNRILQLTDGAI